MVLFLMNVKVMDLVPVNWVSEETNARNVNQTTLDTQSAKVCNVDKSYSQFT